MPQSLPLSPTRLHNFILPGKPREWEQLPSTLRRAIVELCHGERKWPLFIHGTVGSGKSCAALCVADRVAKPEFWAMPAFVSYCQSVKEGKEEWYECGRGGTLTEKGLWNHIAKVPLLILDDVGFREVKNSDYEMEALFLALEARDGKPLICTSNLNDDEIEQNYNIRIRSRMCSGTNYELSGEDRRYQR
jgi:DNA replication protein DnaC